MEGTIWRPLQVDSHFFAEQPGLPSDREETEDGANYLRRLKTQTTGAEPASAVPSQNPIPLEAHAPFSGGERRRSPRFRCSGSAEFTAAGSNVRMWGTLTDISLRGCYVEMTTTFPVDTQVDLVLEALGIRFRAKGVVRISYPFLGMGILIAEIEPDQRVLLEQLIATLSQSSSLPPAAATPHSSADILAEAEPIAFLNELMRFFDSKALLSRDEFFRIAKHCRRS
jgi:PilZ domain